LNPYTGRIDRFRASMAERGWHAALLTPSGDMEYVTGIRRRRPSATENHMHGDWLGGVLVTSDEAIAVAPHLARRHFEEQLRDTPWVDGMIPIDEGEALDPFARTLFADRVPSGGILALPRKAMVQTAVELARLCDFEFRCTSEILGPMRAVKDAGEIRAMEAAAAVADHAFSEVVPALRPGMTELDIKFLVERALYAAGAEGTSFVTGIMIRGEGCDGPLEGVSCKEGHRLEPGRVLAFDFGAVVDGYASDFGRTVFIGEPDAELLRIHALIVQAQAEGMRALVPGTSTREVDAHARRVIEDAGYGEAFFHRLGHGIGIDVHEAPFLAPGSDGTVKENMCFTVEPSVLIPDRCFIRTEDVVRVTPEGGVSLNHTPTDPIII